MVCANLLHTQSISLQQGWNAIYLSVDPESTDLNTLLADTEIDLVASYFSPLSSVEFIDDPSEQDWKSAAWHKWVSPQRDDSFLTNMFQLSSGRGYLVHAKQDYTWQITGKIKIAETNWQANAFTLIGFDIDDNTAPTFEQFFRGSPAHQNLIAYQLLDNKWQLIDQPSQTFVQANSAYWIYSQGDSTFSGGLEFSDLAVDGIDFQGLTSELSFNIKNVSNQSFTFSLTAISGTDSAALVPLSIEQGTTDNSNVVNFESASFPRLDAGEYTQVRLVVDRSLMSAGENRQSFIEMIGAGVKRLIPINANK